MPCHYYLTMLLLIFDHILASFREHFEGFCLNKVQELSALGELSSSTFCSLTIIVNSAFFPSCIFIKREIILFLCYSSLSFHCKYYTMHFPVPKLSSQVHLNVNGSAIRGCQKDAKFKVVKISQNLCHMAMVRVTAVSKSLKI